MLDADIVDFNVLEFRITDSPPPLVLFLLFLFVYSCRRWLKLPTLPLSYVVLLWSMHAPSVPIYTDGSTSSEGVGCAAVFLNLDVFISFFPAVAAIFTEELCAIFFAPF